MLICGTFSVRGGVCTNTRTLAQWGVKDFERTWSWMDGRTEADDWLRLFDRENVESSLNGRCHTARHTLFSLRLLVALFQLEL